MKKIIKGSVYNTKTAKKICEKFTEAPEFEYGAVVKKLQQLYKTKSGKYFFYFRREFRADVVVNNDDLYPQFEEQEVVDEKIEPVSFQAAFRFASEVYSDPHIDLEEKENIEKYFPALTDEGVDENKKYQKKIYLSEKASWYLEMMIDEFKDTNSSFIEKLIIEEYKRLYSEGVMKNDPFFEMEDETKKEMGQDK